MYEKIIEVLFLVELGVDLVIDCMGVFKIVVKVVFYYVVGVKKVVVLVLVKDGGVLNFVYGVNYCFYDGM